MKFKIVEIKKRRFADNRFVGWWFVEKWEATVEFEDGSRKKINFFSSDGRDYINNILFYISNKVAEKHQFGTEDSFIEFATKQNSPHEIVDVQAVVGMEVE